MPGVGACHGGPFDIAHRLHVGLYLREEKVYRGVGERLNYRVEQVHQSCLQDVCCRSVRGYVVEGVRACFMEDVRGCVIGCVVARTEASSVDQKNASMAVELVRNHSPSC